MYGENDKLAKAREYKHMTFAEAAGIAKESGVKKMWLTHYSPSLVYPKEFLQAARSIFSETYVCKDGESTVLDFDKE